MKRTVDCSTDPILKTNQESDSRIEEPYSDFRIPPCEPEVALAGRDSGILVESNGEFELSGHFLRNLTDASHRWDQDHADAENQSDLVIAALTNTWLEVATPGTELLTEREAILLMEIIPEHILGLVLCLGEKAGVFRIEGEQIGVVPDMIRAAVAQLPQCLPLNLKSEPELLACIRDVFVGVAFERLSRLQGGPYDFSVLVGRLAFKMLGAMRGYDPIIRAYFDEVGPVENSLPITIN